MRNSIVPKGSCPKRSERRSLVATVALAALLSLPLAAGNAFGQDQQDTPLPPPQSGQPSGQGMEHGIGGHQMPSVDDQIKHLTKKLKLSDEQQAKLKPILEDQRKQMDQIHSDSSMSRQDRFSKMQELRQNTDTQIKSVLNEDQQKNFDKMREEQHGRMRQWQKGGANIPPAGDSPQ
jgi:protein CpxP